MPPLLTLFYLLVCRLLPLFWPFPCQSKKDKGQPERKCFQLQAADGWAVWLQDGVRFQVSINCLSWIIYRKHEHFLPALKVLTDGLWPALQQHIKEILLFTSGSMPQQELLPASQLLVKCLRLHHRHIFPCMWCCCKALVIGSQAVLA